MNIVGELTGWFARWVEIVRQSTKAAVLATVLFMMAVFSIALATQGELIGRIFDFYSGSQERAASRALEAIARADRANDVAIAGMLRRLMRDVTAGRVVVKILVFNGMTGEFSDLVESHEIMDRRAERTGLRGRTLTRQDVQNTLDQMFPEGGRVVCLTATIDEVPDRELKLFLQMGEMAWTSACPIIDPDGTPVGLLAVSGRQPLVDRPMVQERVRDSAFLLSGYLLRSPAAEAARHRLESPA